MTEFPTFEPAKQPLKAYAGDTFAQLVRLWKNKEKSEPFDLAGYTVTLLIEGVTTLKAGEGLTIDAAEGEIHIELTDVETDNIANGETIAPRYRLRIEKEEKRTTLMRGNFTFEVI
jgi:hypothetical protein